MLTFAQSRTIGGVAVFRDVAYREGQRRLTPVFYALPGAVRLAQDADGGPAFDFLWYRGEAGQSADKAGGLATLTVDLALTETEKAGLLAALTAEFGAEGLGPIEVQSIPFKSGTVELAVAGESSGGDLTNQVAGNGPARLLGAEQATFEVDLNADGAALLWQAIDKQLDILEVGYDLVFDARLDDIKLRVWCDAQRAHQSLAARWQAGALTPAEARAGLVEHRLAGFELDSEQPLEPAHRLELEKSGQDVLEKALGSVFFDINRSLRPFDPGMEASLNYTLSESFPVERHAVIRSALRLGVSAQELGNRLRQVTLDGGFFRILEVKVYCTADFSENTVSKVKATLDYDQTGESGRVEEHGEFVFQEGATMATFRTALAAPDLDSYSYEVEVYFRGDPEPLRLERRTVRGTALVLDLDGLGVLRVRAELRDVPFEVVDSAVVEVEYPPKGFSSRFVLDGEHLAGEWEAVTRAPLEPYRYKADWVLRDGSRIEGEWPACSQPQVFLDAPEQLRRKALVQLISAGDFSALAQILVELRMEGESGAPAQFAFTQAGQSATWQPRLGDPAGLRYEVRRTLVDLDGGRRILNPEWAAEDRNILIVSDALRYEVRVVPRLLDLGGALKLALLELEYADADGGNAQRGVLALRLRDEEPGWKIRLARPEYHRYRYRLSVVTSQGERKPPSEWSEAEDEILVLRPPTS